MGANLFSAYSNITSLEHRKKFGQFFTPSAVAKFMIRWLIANNPKNILDPTFGLGAFAEALDSETSFIDSFKAYELDEHIFQFSKKHFESRVTIYNKDYLLDWNESKFDSIICNPPYMKFQNFQSKENVISIFKEKLGIKLSGYTNTASAFLLKSISELAEGGRLAYIMPFEFMNAGYGKTVKEYLLNNGKIDAFIKINCEKEIFPEVITSVGIILFTKQKEPAPQIPFYVINNISQLNKFEEILPLRVVPKDEINPKDKWSIYFEPNQVKFNAKWLCQINYYGSFSRGIATGANEYFSFNQSKANEFKLPKSSLIPCITKSNQIKSNIFDSNELEKLVRSDASVYLVNLEENSEDRAIKAYIQLGEDQLVHQRYLTKLRSPWFKLEQRRPAEILFGVFFRDEYKVIRNFTNSINLTCYHGFNANPLGTKYLDLLFFYLLSDAGKKIVTINARKYGNGLYKFEPNDLNQALVPNIEWFNSLKKVDVESEYERVRKTEKISEQLNNVFNSLLQ